MNFKQEIINELKKHTKTEIHLEVPSNLKFGDYAFPCFPLTKEFKKNPNDIAQDLAKKIKLSRIIRKVEIKGPYLNFFINSVELAKGILNDIFLKKGKYGKDIKKKKNGKVMVEYSQANTHKSFHVGHLRGTSLGESLSRILKFNGYNVVQTNYQGDTGAHVAKWLWCYLKYHKGEKLPKKNPGKWIASIYVEAVQKSDDNNQKEMDEINYKLENNKDKKLTELWKKSRKWSLDSLDKVYEDLDAHFDNFFFEREMEKRGKELSKELVKEGIAEVNDGATIINLERYNLGIWVLLRMDGTCLYSAKDLALAEKKFKEFKIDKCVYVVGAAQSMHLRQLFKTLELMKFKHADKCHHLSFAEVRFSTGKMSSRTGENVLYSELKDGILKKLKEEVEKRHKEWDKKRKEESVRNIFSAAIKFDMLKQEPNKNIIFDIDRALDFEGETGPYIQYAHARICSIFRKYGKKISNKVNFGLFENEKEKKIISLLGQFPNLLEECAEHYKVHILSRYLLSLAQSFNEFYHECPILLEKEEVKKSRLLLAYCVKEVLSNGLFLLGIKAPEEM